MKKKVIALIKEYRFREAFWAAAEIFEDGALSVSTQHISDEQNRECFLQILRVRNNVAMLVDDEERIHELADKGNPFMQLAYARLHDCLVMEENSTEIYLKYYKMAAEAGIADARAYIAVAYRDGDDGEPDEERYREELQRALAEGSDRAVQLIMNDMIFGTNGVEANPQMAHDNLESAIAGAEERGLWIDPIYYTLLAYADLEMGNKVAAITEFGRSYDKGFLPALFNFAFYQCSDDKGVITERERFAGIMESGRECGCADSYLAQIMLMDGDEFDELDVEEQARTHMCLEEDLKRAAKMGEGIAAYYLGRCYEEGQMGFEEDMEKARNCYLRGAMLRDNDSIEALERLNDYDDDYDYEREVGEDDWGMDPDVDLSYQTCCECLEGIQKRLQEQDRRWEIAGIVRRFMAAAERIMAETRQASSLRNISVENENQMLEEVCETGCEIADSLYDHPRLKVELLMMLKTVFDRMGRESEELTEEIAYLLSNIRLADAGRLSEIKQQGHLKHDPVEWTREWEDNIDRADEMACGKLKGVPRGMGFCFEYWHELSLALAEFDIVWKNPHLMNPRVRFD